MSSLDPTRLKTKQDLSDEIERQTREFLRRGKAIQELPNGLDRTQRPAKFNEWYGRPEDDAA